MFCPKCGTQNPDNGKFCRTCGTDLSPVSDALAGKSRDRTPNAWKMQPMQPIQLRDRKGKSVNWESAFGKLFTGIAFLAVAIALALSERGNGWWFWMLIPGFGALGGGLAQIYQLRKLEAEKKFSPALEAKTNDAFAPVSSAASLPPTRTEYVERQKSIYDTGEFAAPPSVVEGTTRHLEMNTEGETMTLDENVENGKWKMEN